MPNASRPGVQQILLLPVVGKACVLCNWTVTFYSLPELSPVFGSTQVRNCNWIGGVDLNEEADNNGPSGVAILLSLKRRIQVVRIGEDARVIKVRTPCRFSLTLGTDSKACDRKSTLRGVLYPSGEIRSHVWPILGATPCWMSIGN